jgi:dUTP pyrophosphatase
MDPIHMKPDVSPIVKKKLPFIEHGLGHFQPYSRWSAPTMPVTGEYLCRRSSISAAGYDLFAADTYQIPPVKSKHPYATVNCGISVEIPVGHYGKIEGQTLLGYQHNIIAFGGIIDEDYRGTIHVKLFNHSNKAYTINKGDSVAQLVIQRYCVPIILSTNVTGYGLK